jgi:hypothetical protein
LYQRGSAGRIVVCSVVDQTGAVWIQAAESAATEVIVVRAQNDGLVPEHGIVTGKDANHIAPDQRTSPGVPAGGRISADRERLEPSAGGRLKPHL